MLSKLHTKECCHRVEDNKLETLLLRGFIGKLVIEEMERRGLSPGTMSTAPCTNT